MPAKIVITKEGVEDWKDGREFGQDIVTIGRSNENTLMLEDPNKIVSREHAEINYVQGSYYLVDNGSRNYTFLNTQKVPAKKPQLLKVGDIIQIGEYCLECTEISEAQPLKINDATVVLINPFEEDLQIFAGLMNKMKRTYGNAATETRDDQLRTALFKTLTLIDTERVGEIFAEMLFNHRPGNKAKAN